MSEDKKKFRHVALEQLKLMLDFMAQHPDLASGTRLRTLEARYQSKQRWNELSKILNSHRGAKKTPDGWSKHWSDFKNKLKNKLAERRRRNLETFKKNVRPFTKLQKQALEILGPIFEKNQKGHNVLESTPCDPLPIEIKQESMLETALSNGHYQLVDNDVSLGLESGDSKHSSDNECVEDGDQSINHKLLIDIERTRANAEMIRAKAEEVRAEISVKLAEAALVQADAMKKLSEAAEKQADAILRIAMAIENKPEIINMQSGHLPPYQ